MEFKSIQEAVSNKLKIMSVENLFTTEASKDKMWEVYLNSFPAGSNPMFRTRTEHDCQCCKRFIRAAGNIVSFKGGKVVSIWDIKIKGEENKPYQIVANAMSKYVKSKAIKNVFLADKQFKLAGSKPTLDSCSEIVWDHFYFKFDDKYLLSETALGSKLSITRSKKEVLKRSLDEITMDAIDTVIELIEQNSIERGEEHLRAVTDFKRNKAAYETLTDSGMKKEIFCWLTTSLASERFQPIKNTVVGTLLMDISEGKTLDYAVDAFELKTCSQNFKRNSALVTKAMINRAHARTIELGIEDALHRRHATIEDITINNIIFADRDAKNAMSDKTKLGVFSNLSTKAASVKPKNLDKVEEVQINTFIDTILPKSDSIEIFVENEHEKNLMSVITPTVATAKNILKWNNNLSWTYVGNVTDSIKSRVKKAGGDVTGHLRCSLSWFNTDDLDIHMTEPDRNVICFNDKFNSRTKGRLDVDMNVSNPVTDAVENITWPDKARMQEGTYEIRVNNYTERNKSDYGFDLEIECEGKILNFHRDKFLRENSVVNAVSFKFTKKNGIKLVSKDPTMTNAKSEKEFWNISSGQFHPVSVIMYSPNHWDKNQVGNKHLFFIMPECHSPGKVRGLYNEFLTDKLHDDRKVFEHLGAELKAPESNSQLSGLGFSSTKRNHLYCKVTGAFTRTIKILF